MISNWTYFSDEKLQTDDFSKAHEDFWLKFGIMATIPIGLVSCACLLLVSYFERSGESGPFRTLINQLVSMSLDQMSILFLSGSVLDSLRGHS